MKKKNYKVKLKVKELLEERNITQKKLAQISGIRESTMIRMEELEQARKEVDKAEDKKPMKQNMFKVV